MATLLLRLAAPLQSWGADSKFDTRRTGGEPTKSGVIGLLAAALGIRRDADAEIQALSAALRFGVRVDKEGELLRDFHMAHSEKTAYLTNRYYLSDAVFLVGLESDDAALLAKLEDALHHPAFPLFLGRRSCPPTPPLSLGVRDGELLTVLREEPRIPHEGKSAQRFRLVTDGIPGERDTGIQQDVPASFDPRCRRFADRAVTQWGFVALPDETASYSFTEHDPMSELGGELL